jgi:hypothetical protein
MVAPGSPLWFAGCLLWLPGCLRGLQAVYSPDPHDVEEAKELVEAFKEHQWQGKVRGWRRRLSAPCEGFWLLAAWPRLLPLLKEVRCSCGCGLAGERVLVFFPGFCSATSIQQSS